ncbi:hypothetical protein ACFQY7_18010 [Actinomadura luteofluorescens]|uniref:Uncharacterized protein n=1 Tax=Actinomadura luteofluorescens TaxID=46163 RepID=A0A7Y9EQ58_9ACTN|nr:hypothetical protein [Actinomadura luteofluorescens]NYD51721.1 hypothetical protein [Actinomadura luteofluorescens]
MIKAAKIVNWGQKTHPKMGPLLVLAELLPLVLAATMADVFQALFGFGLIGIKRTVPSMMCFAVCYGALAIAAGPAAAMGGLSGLWGALLSANLVLTAAQS